MKAKADRPGGTEAGVAAGARPSTRRAAEQHQKQAEAEAVKPAAARAGRAAPLRRPDRPGRELAPSVRLGHGPRPLDQCSPEPGEPDRRGWEWSYLDRWCRPELRTICPAHRRRIERRRREPRRPPPRRRLCDPFAVSADKFPPVPTY